MFGNEPLSLSIYRGEKVGHGGRGVAYIYIYVLFMRAFAETPCIIQSHGQVGGVLSLLGGWA